MFVDVDTSDTTSSVLVKNEDSSDEEPTLPDTEVSENNTVQDSEDIPCPTELSLNQQPCSSHSDNPTSRSLRPRPRPANKKLRIYRSSSPSRKIAPRRAKLQAEQLLQEYVSSEESD